jgi:hypothetical protein
MLKSLEIGMVYNYLKLDSISIVGWSDGGIDWNGYSGKSKIKKIVAMVRI